MFIVFSDVILHQWGTNNVRVDNQPDTKITVD